jgi:hypothetical protein
MKKSDANPIDPVQRLRNAPRCTAVAKSTRERCKCPSRRGWSVCRVHGAGGGAPQGTGHPNYRHGLRAVEMKEMRSLVSLLSTIE